jgi:predicted ester cyclase
MSSFPQGGPAGMTGVGQTWSFLNAFPDLHVTVENMIAEGDTVVAFKTLTGTHRGTHLGVPPTDKRVRYQIVSIYRIKNGKIAGYWGIQDELSLRRQLGVVE